MSSAILRMPWHGSCSPFLRLTPQDEDSCVMHGLPAAAGSMPAEIDSTPMTTQVFIRIREPANGRALISELLEDGIASAQIRAYGNSRPAHLPVTGIPWRSEPRAALEGAALGAGVMFILVLFAGIANAASGLLLVLLGAAGGGGWWLLHNRRRMAPVAAQSQALRDGELLLAVDVDDADVGEFERRINARHPEMLVLGADAAGSPPFP
jgi:hypothetical protein